VHAVQTKLDIVGLTLIITCKCSSDYGSICPVGHDTGECRREVDLSIQRLFYWGTYADRYGEKCR